MGKARTVHLPDLAGDLALIPEHRRFGRVTGVMGLLLEVGGLPRRLAVGGRCVVLAPDRPRLVCEVVGFRAGRVLLMPFGPVYGVGLGCRVEIEDRPPAIYPHDGWLGRVLNAMGEPIDGKGPLPLGPVAYSLRNAPPLPHARRRVHGKVDLGVRALNTFLTCCRGQRMGIFAASGVGKSALLSMIARYRLGAYKRRADPRVDEAIRRYPLIEAFLSQAKAGRADLASGYAQLAALLAAPT